MSKRKAKAKAKKNLSEGANEKEGEGEDDNEDEDDQAKNNYWALVDKEIIGLRRYAKGKCQLRKKEIVTYSY